MQCAAKLADCKPLLLLVFSGGRHDPRVVMHSLRSRFPGVPVVGGSAAGVIAAEDFGYSGFEIGIIALTDPRTVPEVLVRHDLLAGEYEAGRNLGREVRDRAGDSALVMLFYDSVAQAEPLLLHPASALVDGVQDGLGDRRVSLVGGGLLTDLNLGGGWVFDGEAVCHHAVLALVFPPCVTASTAICHGCRPVSTFMEITRIEGANVYELDGQPALSVLERLLGLRVAGDAVADLTLTATLGHKQGDPFAPFEEDAYVNRLILGGDRATGSVTLFEPDFREGTQVQVMSRDNELMLQSVRTGVERANAAIRGGDALFTLYVDCAGRASARTGAAMEEADLVRTGIDPSVPFLGFYSGVEIAPFDGRARALDWTGVLVTVGRSS